MGVKFILMSNIIHFLAFTVSRSAFNALKNNCIYPCSVIYHSHRDCANRFLLPGNQQMKARGKHHGKKSSLSPIMDLS